MDLKQIRQLLKEGRTVVLVEDGQPPLVVSELRRDPPTEEVPIASRWPKGLPAERHGRTVHDGIPPRDRQDQVLERLNNEILALKAEIAEQEQAGGQGEQES